MQHTMGRLVRYLSSVPAAFVTEVVAAIGVAADEIDAVLDSADGGHFVVVDHASPDAHVVTDLRIVSLIVDCDLPAARERAQRHWQIWFRDFVGSHRCS